MRAIGILWVILAWWFLLSIPVGILTGKILAWRDSDAHRP